MICPWLMVRQRLGSARPQRGTYGGSSRTSSLATSMLLLAVLGSAVLVRLLSQPATPRLGSLLMENRLKVLPRHADCTRAT